MAIGRVDEKKAWLGRKGVCVDGRRHGRADCALVQTKENMVGVFLYQLQNARKKAEGTADVTRSRSGEMQASI